MVSGFSALADTFLATPVLADSIFTEDALLFALLVASLMSFLLADALFDDAG